MQSEFQIMFQKQLFFAFFVTIFLQFFESFAFLHPGTLVCFSATEGKSATIQAQCIREFLLFNRHSIKPLTPCVYGGFSVCVT